MKINNQTEVKIVKKK